MITPRCPVRQAVGLGAADGASLASAALAVAAGVVILTYGGFSLTDDGVPLLLLPPAALAAPVLARGTQAARSLRIAVAALMTAFWLLGAASIGWLFAPAALAAIVAASLRHPRT